MPRTILGTQERIQAVRQSNTRRKGKSIERILATVKYKIGYHDIAKQSGISYATVCKIINNPLAARVEQLLQISEICGIDLEIVEKSPPDMAGNGIQKGMF